jgi:hypothetical protein
MPFAPCSLGWSHNPPLLTFRFLGRATNKRRLKMNDYVIVQDTREQRPWYFKNKVVKKLDSGDYSIVGCETSHCIERKGSITEFARNLTEKRFERELIRLNDMIVAIVILEFEYQALIDWPENAGLTAKQKSFVRTTGKFLRKRLHEYEERYPNVKFLFCGYSGRKTAMEEFAKWMHTIST